MSDNQHDSFPGEETEPLTGEVIKQRLHQNYQSVLNSLSIAELRMLLVQEGLLTALEAESISDAASLLRKFEEEAQQDRLEVYTMLYKCINQLDHHLGHRYVKILFEGGEYATEEEIEHSDMIKQNVRKNLSKLVNCDVPALALKMVSCELLTYNEMEQLLTAQVGIHSLLLRLINILNTKGPLAYSLFADCLRRETEHVTHAELYDLITKPILSNGQRKRKRSENCQELPTEVCCAGVQLSKHHLPVQKLHGCLHGKLYDALMQKFQSCHHNGKWAELEAETAKFLSVDSPPELQVVCLQERAVSWIFRKEEAKVVQLVGQAMKLLSVVKGDNSVLLHGRCEYILSRLYRYLKQYDKAQQHVERATYLLKYVEPGEDSAFVRYCDACIKVERLSENSTTQQIEDAEMCYKYAIDHAHRHDSGLDLVVPHSLMRLAQMYLGSSHYTAGSKHDPESVQSASNCLHQVNVSSLAYRSKCHFHLIQSDLLRSQRERGRAMESAHLALDIAKEYNFTLEICSAMDRLDSL